MAVDNFEGDTTNLLGSAVSAVAITPHDTNELSVIPRALWIGVSGDVKVTLRGDTTAVVFKSVPVGWLEVRPKLVWSTGTTATNILGVLR
jgi:hypothetical protein